MRKAMGARDFVVGWGEDGKNGWAAEVPQWMDPALRTARAEQLQVKEYTFHPQGLHHNMVFNSVSAGNVYKTADVLNKIAIWWVTWRASS
jgi:hypothetical protein